MDVKPFLDTRSPLQRYAVFSIIASLLTLGLKTSAYFLTGSISVLSDAVESLVNVATAGITYIVLVIAKMPADDNHPYGHEKVEYFSSAAEGVLILVAALTIFYSAVTRFFKPVALEHLLSGIGIVLAATVINGICAYFLKKAGQAHDSIALSAEAEHLMSDVWTSVAVMIGIFCIRFLPPKWQILDPIIALIITTSTLKVGFELLMRSGNGLMDMALPSDEFQKIIEVLQKTLPSSASFEKLRTRKSGSKRFIDFILMVPGSMSVYESHQLCDELEEKIMAQLGNSSITIHVEPKKADNIMERY